MNIVMELALIFGVCLIGIGIAALLPFMVPYSVISLLVLTFLFYRKWLRPEQVKDAGGFFIRNMGIFFVPAVVGTMEYVETLKNYLVPFLVITLVTTPLVYFVVTGRSSFACTFGGKESIMPDAFTRTPFFWPDPDLCLLGIGGQTQKKTGWLLCNPVLTSSLMIVVILTVLGVPLKHFNAGGSVITMLLGPATAVLALNIYQQRKVLQENFLPVLAGCVMGSLVSIVAALTLCHLFGTNSVFSASMLPKSVTTAIALGISENGGRHSGHYCRGRGDYGHRGSRDRSLPGQTVPPSRIRWLKGWPSVPAAMR